MSSLSDKKIFVAGHRGMVGAAIVRKLKAIGVEKLLVKSRSELDLCNQSATNAFFASEKPEVVLFAAARVGGIHANNTYPANFIYENLTMATNAIHAAYHCGCERFLFLGSTCIYPREAPQPMPETSLLTSPLEKTNEAYAIAKIAGLKMCQFYRQQYGVLFHSAMPTNLYGPGDNYHPDNSHVMPALIRRLHQAKQEGLKEVVIWGTGKPRREFLHVEDLAEAIVFLSQVDSPPDLVNLGTGQDISIQELAELVADIVGYQGLLTNDRTKPDGTMLKRTDTKQINHLGWSPRIGLRDGIAQTYQSYLAELQANSIRER
ncbi:MAG: GDP-L-fucose synthase [Planctomycetes bacterium]|nr:GDP-L-fucose synthase [Planctomycetota bacterium]